ncbi:MAG: superoxide dismutase family protein [Acidobacteria bacterium]|nr:MAG: superoxide dismutase family protein [Acidobacteriota bacterium]
MKTRTCLMGVLALLLVVSCGSEPSSTPSPVPSAPEPDQTMSVGFVKAIMQPLGESGVTGIVSFSVTPRGVRVEADLKGLAPGNHGFHIHEIGDCSSPDGKSAGGHFNPADVPHAGPEAEAAHAGDLGNLEADENGQALITIMSSRVTLGDGAPTDIMGRAVIVHADPDDLESQPTGAAGGRVACGVIESSE